MTGLELARKYYELCGVPMLREEFPEWEGLIAVGLCGSGSECFGYDDEVSRDHDFEAGFCLFLPDEDILDRRTAFRLERAYAKLPKEFEGFKKSFLSPVGGNRHGVVRVSEFFTEKLGNPNGTLSMTDWLRLPENSILEAANGEIWRDDADLMISRRTALLAMPEDVRLKKLAGELLTMAQAGQYNYARCLAHGEPAAAQLADGEFVRAALHGIFLLNHRLMPYYKWQFRALRDLPLLSDLAQPLYELLITPNDADNAGKKAARIEEIGAAFIDVLKAQDLSSAVCLDLEKHAYSVNDRVSDNDLRNASVFAAV